MIAGDDETRSLYALALTLGVTLGHVLDMPVEELRGWVAFLEWRERNKKGGHR